MAAHDARIGVRELYAIVLDVLYTRVEPNSRENISFTSEVFDSHPRVRCALAGKSASVTEQVQACAIAAILTSCCACRKGLERLQVLFAYLVKSGRVGIREASYARRSFHVMRAFCALYAQLADYRNQRSGERPPSRCVYNPTSAVLSLLAHATTELIEDVVDERVERSLSTVITDAHKDCINAVNGAVDAVIRSENIVKCVAFLRYVVVHSPNRDTDWFALFVERASYLSRFNALPNAVRLLPVYVSVVVHACGGPYVVDSVLCHLACALVGRMCGDSMMDLHEHGSGVAALAACSMHTRRRCCILSHHRALSFRLTRDGAPAQALKPQFCCKRHTRHSLQPFATASEIAFEDWWRSLSGVVEEVRDPSNIELVRNDAVSEPGLAAITAATSSDAMPVETFEIPPGSVASYRCPFSGPIVSSDDVEKVSRVTPNRNPRTLMAVLCEDIDADSARKGQTVMIRGPFYRNESKTGVQINDASASARLAVYLNSLKQRRNIAGIDAIPLMRLMRSPNPIGHTYTTSVDEQHAWNAICTTLFTQNGESRDGGAATSASIQEIPIGTDEQAYNLAARPNTNGMYENACARDLYGMMPIWLAMSDPSGDYRSWPLSLRTSAALAYTPPRMMLHARSHAARDRYMRAVYTTTLDMYHGKSRAMFPEPEHLYHSYVYELEPDSAALVQRIYMYLLYRSLFGVMAKVNKRNFVVHKCDDGSVHIRPSQDITHAWPREPEFDWKKRRVLPPLAPKTFPAQYDVLRNAPSNLSFDTYRRKRIDKANAVINDIIRPMARVMHQALRIMDMNFAEREDHHIVELQELLKEAQSFNHKNTASTKTIHSHLHTTFMKEACMFVPTVTQKQWYGIVGSLAYMSARVLNLKTSVWGVLPRAVYRMMSFDVDNNYIMSRAQTRPLSWMWIESLATDEPFDVRTMKGFDRDRYNVVHQRYLYGWPFHNRDRFADVAEVAEQWRDAVRTEIVHLRALCDKYMSQIDKIRKCHERGGEPWKRMSYALEQLKARDAPPSPTRKMSFMTNGDVIELSCGQIHWDPDRTPDPVWLAHLYLPYLHRCIDRAVKMYRGAHNDDHKSWFDLLEFTHGQSTLERYAEALSIEMKRVYQQMFTKRAQVFFQRKTVA